MRNFRELEVWKEGINFSVETYELLKSFPDSEKYNLISQIQRNVVSIPSNIAEGASRSSSKDFARFLEISLGSSFELETQLEIAYKLGYLPIVKRDELFERLEVLQKRINRLRTSILKKT